MELDLRQLIQMAYACLQVVTECLYPVPAQVTPRQLEGFPH